MSYPTLKLYILRIVFNSKIIREAVLYCEYINGKRELLVYAFPIIKFCQIPLAYCRTMYKGSATKRALQTCVFQDHDPAVTIFRIQCTLKCLIASINGHYIIKNIKKSKLF